jgi:hypothetical protein
VVSLAQRLSHGQLEPGSHGPSPLCLALWPNPTWASSDRVCGALQSRAPVEKRVEISHLGLRGAKPLATMDSRVRREPGGGGGFDSRKPAPCLFGLSATSQQYFSLRTNQPAVLFSQNKSASAISHQPNEQTAGLGREKRSQTRD